MSVRRCLFVLALFSSTVSAAAQDNLIAIGELVFFGCQGCHLVGEAKLVKVGPHLNGLFGRKPGSLPDYEYSQAMIEFGKDKVWDETTLAAYLRDPAGIVPGNKMKFPGNKNPAEVRALLAYLATF